jgi:hypothetical protein
VFTLQKKKRKEKEIGLGLTDPVKAWVVRGGVG